MYYVTWTIYLPDTSITRRDCNAIVTSYDFAKYRKKKNVLNISGGARYGDLKKIECHMWDLNL